MKKLADSKVIVFDQGNTLVFDPFILILDHIKSEVSEILKKFSKNITAKDIRSNWVLANSKIDYPFISHFAQEEPIIIKMLDLLKIDPLTQSRIAPKILYLYRKNLPKFTQKTSDKEKLHKVLSYLQSKQKRLGIFSNDREFDLQANLQLLEIKNYFEYIRSSEDLKVEKPDQRVFEDIQTHFREKPEDIIYIGDDPIRDVQAAKEYGMKAIWLKLDNKYNEKWRDYSKKPACQPDAVISDIKELLHII